MPTALDSTTTPSPLIRPRIHMTSANNGAADATSSLNLPIVGIALGQIAPWLQRVLIERFQVPADDPIHAMVEVVRAEEQAAALLIEALSNRATKEGEFTKALETAHSDVSKLAEKERESLRPELKNVSELLAQVRAALNSGNESYTKVDSKISLLPELKEALEADVNARARERFGHSVALIITAVIFLTLGVLGTALFFTHFFRVQ